MLPAPNRPVLRAPHIEGKLNVRGEIRGGLVFVKYINHLGIPCGSEAGVIIAVAVSFDEEDMVISVSANRRGQFAEKFAQQGSVGEIPVCFVDQVVSCYPRFILVALGNLVPKPDGFAAILRTFPKRRFGRVVVTDSAVATLSARCRVQIDDDVDPGACAP